MNNFINEENLIKKFPELPEEIKTAYENKDLVVFIGAGISRLMGCESWESMSNNLVKATCKAGIAHQIVNSNFSSKAKITIAKRYAEKNNRMPEFWEIFHKAITKDKSKNDIYGVIKNLNTTFITTNCDGLLTKYYPHAFETVCTQESFEANGNRPFVFCIHGNWGNGSEKDKKTLVFTTEDYLEKYRPESELYKFLKAALQKTVLFIGYGLNEFEILNVVFEKKNPQNGYKHFSLDGFYNYQQEYVDAVSSYYSSVGIKIIPYSLDEKGYDQQIDIVSEWINELLNSTTIMICTTFIGQPVRMVT